MEKSIKEVIAIFEKAVAELLEVAKELKEKDKKEGKEGN